MAQECQQDKCELITISCKLSEKNKKGKWFVINVVSVFYIVMIIMIKVHVADDKKMMLLYLKNAGT